MTWSLAMTIDPRCLVLCICASPSSQSSSVYVHGKSYLPCQLKLSFLFLIWMALLHSHYSSIHNMINVLVPVSVLYYVLIYLFLIYNMLLLWYCFVICHLFACFICTIQFYNWQNKLLLLLLIYLLSNHLKIQVPWVLNFRTTKKYILIACDLRNVTWWGCNCTWWVLGQHFYKLCTGING